jgi:hypothetical protein
MSSDEGVYFHFRQDLLEALVVAIAHLNKGYTSVLNFFRGAGVPPSMMAAEAERVARKEKISKFEIARNILVRLNEAGNSGAAIERRRIVARRVAEWENFNTCWEDKVLEAKGAVAEVQRIINVYDSFTKMKQVRDAETSTRLRAKDAERQALAARVEEGEKLRRELYALFGTTNPQKRGKALEPVLNRLFAWAGIGIREAFSVVHDETGKELEQIDGVIELDHRFYLVEMKWEKEPLGTDQVVKHIGRVFMRKNSGDIRGLVVSASGFTEPAIINMKNAKGSGAFVFGCTLFHIFRVLEERSELKDFFKDRVVAADVDGRHFVA